MLSRFRNFPSEGIMRVVFFFFCWFRHGCVPNLGLLKKSKVSPYYSHLIGSHKTKCWPELTNNNWAKPTFFTTWNEKYIYWLIFVKWMKSWWKFVKIILVHYPNWLEDCMIEKKKGINKSFRVLIADQGQGTVDTLDFLANISVKQ